MAKFNIIYKSLSGDHFICSSTSLLKIGSADRSSLLYSGKSVKSVDVDLVLDQSKKLISRLFPNDMEPDLKPVQISVS